MEVTEKLANDLANYNTLKLKIEIHLKVYTELLTEYETELKRYLKQDIPSSLLDVQQTLISKTKAKISALEDLNN